MNKAVDNLVEQVVEIEAFGSFPALVKQGENWNGFYCPYFDKETADKIMESVNNSDYEVSMTFNETTNAYEYTEEDSTESYEAVTVNGQTLYPIGSHAWIWS